MLKMELHKEIAAWLAKFKLIQANSKALTPNAEIEDLVAIIRDGVVLCQVKQMVDAYCVSYSIFGGPHAKSPKPEFDQMRAVSAPCKAP